MKQLDLKRINEQIADRTNVFYWQTDRVIEPDEAGHIWADRHRYFTDQELIEAVNKVLEHNKLVSIEPFNLEAQTNLGNVNSVRVGLLESGKGVVIRSHPKGIKNGYFHAEAAAASKAKKTGLPSYDTLVIHDYEGGDDFAFQVIEKLPGIAIKKWLDDHPEDESELLVKIGDMMAKLHQVQVDGFGPFDNKRAKDDDLVGLHSTLRDAVMAGLDFNLNYLTQEKVLSANQAKAAKELFITSPQLSSSQSVLVHNDFADWNLLTDGKDITGILDWDECVGGDPVEDIACWSTFFEPERLDEFLKGYWQVANKPADFQDKFELFRLRYVISKMTLRLRRYTWAPDESVKERIEAGKIHLTKSMEYFDL